MSLMKTLTIDGQTYDVGESLTSGVTIKTINNNSIVGSGDLTFSTMGIFDAIYPIGSIYMSVNNANPQLLFGGEWEQIQDTFLLSAGSTYTAGDTGGSPYIQAHTHTGTYTRPTVSKSVSSADSITGGSHSHALSGNNKTVQSGSSYMRPKTYSTSESTVSGYTTSSTTHTHSVPAHAHTLTGGGYSVGAVNGLPTGQTTGDQGNMPPYLVVYVWKRTA